MEEESFDPNIPDTSNGDFFCKICFARTNSEGTWASHIAGKRHIKNMIKYPNALFERQIDEDKDTFEKPAKYGRYETDDKWGDYCLKEYEDGYYSKKDYIPEIKCQVIDYGHRKSLPEEILLPDPKVFYATRMERKDKDLMNKILEDEKLERMKKPFKMEYSNKQSNGMLHDIWKNNNLRKSRKETKHDNDDFEKELDELLKKNSSVNIELSDKDIFCQDKFKKHIDDLLQGKSKNATPNNEDREIIDISGEKDVKYKSFREKKAFDHRISGKKRDDKDKTKFDRDSDKKKGRMKEDKDFVDIFHQMNDQKLFKMSAEDEVEDSSLKNSKTDDSKLDDFDPEKLTPDLLDNLLNSYLKPKANSSKGKESIKSYVKNSTEKDVKYEDPDILAEKLEALPTETFFRIILTRLKKLDLKDVNELNMLLDVISEAQEVVCKKLHPHIQATIRSRLSQNNSQGVTAVQSSKLPQANFVPTTLPQVPQLMPQIVLPTVSQSITKCGSQAPSQEKAVSPMVPRSVKPLISYSSLPTKPSLLNTSDSLQSMIAWQKYLSSKGDVSQTVSTKPALNSSNSVYSILEYQNYLSSLQAKAQAASKISSTTTSDANSKNSASVKNILSNFKTVSAMTSNTAIASPVQSAPLTTFEKPAVNTGPVQNKDALQNFLYTMQAAASKMGSRTSNSSTSSAISSTRNSSQNQSLQKRKYAPQINVQSVSNKSKLPSNSTDVLNQSALLNYRAYYQRMFGDVSSNSSSSGIFK